MIVMNIAYRSKEYIAYCDNGNVRIAKKSQRINPQTKKVVHYEHSMTNPESQDYRSLMNRVRQRLGNMNET